MVNVSPIRTEADYDAALARIEALFHAEMGTPEGDELDILVTLVERYEDEHHPIDFPSAIGAIEFCMDQQELSQRDLIPYIGSRAKVSEVLSGKRAITMAMARALHRHLGIPADILLQEPGGVLDPTFDHIDPRRFPLKQMVKRGWIPDLPDLADRAEELIADLIERAGGQRIAAAPLYRKSDHRRINAKTDEYALKAWCWQLLAQTNTTPPQENYRSGVIAPEFLREVARLSRWGDGPRRARDFLAQHGVALQVLAHLPRTYLDGAALWASGGWPVIGLTLRYDRIDNFWFTLLHELAHVGRHLDGDHSAWFVDDLSLRAGEGLVENPRETEADKWAEEALIPPDVWQASLVHEDLSAMEVIDLAQALEVHPAVIAGRVRYERRNYRLLSQFVGAGQIRRQLEADDLPHSNAAGLWGSGAPTRNAPTGLR